MKSKPKKKPTKKATELSIENSTEHKTMATSKERSWIEKWFDRWGGLGNLTVNLVLAIFTGAVFFLSIRQSKSAEDSSKAAIEAVKLSKEQFSVKNTPYLMVKDFRSIEFATAKSPVFNYSIVNLGDYPVKTISANFTWVILSSKKSDAEIKGDIINSLKTFIHDTTGSITYIYHQPELQRTTPGTSLVSDTSYENVMNGSSSLCFGQETIYKNLMNGDSYKFTYIGRVLSIKPCLVQIVFVDNIPIKIESDTSP